MTPEQVARIVKVCNKIGWPQDGKYVLAYMLEEFVWAEQHKEKSTLKINIECTTDNAVCAHLERHFRQWLVGRYDRVLIEYTSDMPFKWRIECGLDREMESRVRLAGNDYLDLLLTAVEKTLEQENTK